MLRKILSIFVIAVLLFNVGPFVTTQAQDEPPPNNPTKETLKLLQDYIQTTFSSSSIKGKTQSQPLAPYFSPSLSPFRLDKADPDECYNGIGNPYSGTVGSNCTDSPYYPSSQPKVNQSYVWGLVQHGEDLFFGTAANPLCMVMGAFGASPIETDSYVCEFGSSQYAPLTGASFGGWRAPKAFRYDTGGGGETPLEAPASPEASVTFTNTLGLRSAGTISDTVFLAGPALNGKGVNIFAYDADTGDFISSTVLTDYNNIRRWVNVDNILYTGVAISTTLFQGGAVLRYTGDPDVPGELFQFEEVGRIAGDAAELALHDGRLFVSTWPAGPFSRASLWMSPEVPVGGLPASASLWTKVWQIDQYDPDLVTAGVTGGGALASFDGYLHWGTMNVPFLSYMSHMMLYPPNPAWDDETMLAYQIATLLGSHRAIKHLPWQGL